MIRKINLKQLPVLLIDIMLAALSFYLALLLRYDFNIHPGDLANLPVGLLIVVIARGIVFYAFGLYRGLGKYAGLGEYMLIIRSVIVGSVIYIFIFWVFVVHRFPRVALIYDPILLTLFLGGAHFSQRIIQDMFRKRPVDSSRVLIYGAGDAGDMAIREIIKNRHLPYNVIGFIDDDPEKINTRINGVPVLGNRNSLAKVVKQHRIDELIIAIPSASGKEIRTIYESAEPLGIKISTVPNLKEILEKRYAVSEIRNVRLEDLIRRKPVEIADTNAESYLAGKTVLVTGAAGSIGTELSKHLAEYSPETLLMVDRDESNLFYLEQSLLSSKIKCNMIFLLLDIGNIAKLEKLFKDFKPQVVFHSAAFKHVPIMEKQPDEAVENNINNTLNLAKISERYEVEKFVNVSTDKAVYPTSVMGATKRIAELVLLHYFDNSKTKFMTVRFGNVIGSRGSVVPIFKDQIKNGGPVTVTDPDMERFFMTIPEAANLITQACAQGQGGELFILDMGEPVRIVNLAKDMIRLSGLKEQKDIEIVFSGKRPGEKMMEELWFKEENPQPTEHNKILRARQNAGRNLKGENFESNLNNLINYAKNGDKEKVLNTIEKILPGYNSSMN
ncbi:polysaccharide biosynthesis protein [candidate division KSB1 bacterium]